MEAVKFAEWLAENHYKLHHIIVQNGAFVWRSKCDNYIDRSTDELYQIFINDTTK